MKYIITFIVLSISTVNAFSQEFIYSQHFNDFNIIVGKVSNHFNKGLRGISVVLKHSKKSTYTDSTGVFSIYGQSKDSIIISYSNRKSIILSLLNSPLNFENNDISISFAYKNITNVSIERPSKMSVNSFKFPPLKGYTSKVLPRSIFKDCKSLGTANNILIQALSDLGYDETSYFLIPNGFAIVTRIEEINADGSSYMNSDRFSINETSSMSFIDFFAPRKGYYRLFAFLVTDLPFKPNTIKINIKSATNWSIVGYNVLPKKIATLKFDNRYDCSVLVYEFNSTKANATLNIQKPLLSATEHLEKSKIIFALGQNNSNEKR